MVYKPLNLFIIYSREDLAFLRRFERHLNLLIKNGTLAEVWSDGKITPGSEWDFAIKSKINNADLILMLISIDFFNSDYIEKQELKIAFSRHYNKEAVVIPILVRPCHWKSHKQVQSLQILPRNAQPIATWQDQDEAFTDVLFGIEQAIIDFTNRRNVDIEKEVKRAIALYKAEKDDEAFQIFIKYLPTNLPIDGEASNDLGYIYSLKADYIEAYKWFKLSADLGYAKGQFNLGTLYETGKGVAKNLLEACKLYAASANQNYENAEYNLGRMYLNGYGVPKNLEEAHKLFYSAANKEHLQSQYLLAMMYLNKNEVYKDETAGLYWLKRSAERGYAWSQSYLGAIYMDEKNYPEAFHWIRKAADQNDIDALNFLGEIYRDGYGTPPDINKAVLYYKQAAELGSTEAIETLKKMGY